MFHQSVLYTRALPLSPAHSRVDFISISHVHMGFPLATGHRVDGQSISLSLSLSSLDRDRSGGVALMITAYALTPSAFVSAIAFHSIDWFFIYSLSHTHMSQVHMKWPFIQFHWWTARCLLSLCAYECNSSLGIHPLSLSIFLSCLLILFTRHWVDRKCYNWLNDHQAFPVHCVISLRYPLRYSEFHLLCWSYIHSLTPAHTECPFYLSHHLFFVTLTAWEGRSQYPHTGHRVLIFHVRVEIDSLVHKRGVWEMFPLELHYERPSISDRSVQSAQDDVETTWYGDGERK